MLVSTGIYLTILPFLLQLTCTLIEVGHCVSTDPIQALWALGIHTVAYVFFFAAAACLVLYSRGLSGAFEEAPASLCNSPGCVHIPTLRF
jgi:hypothetical protein